MTRPWTYGDEGAAYPVRPGDIWQVGPHLYVCSDLMESDQFKTVCKQHQPSLLYCDPPWGQALLNGFRTKAGLGKVTYRWEDLYRRILAVGGGIPSYIEGSKPDSRDGAKIPALLPGTHRTQWTITYYRTNPSGLYYTGRTPPPPMRLEGVDDDHTPGIVLAAYPTGTVIDPCAGRGLTSRHAHTRGWTSISNELHPARMSAALARQTAHTGTEPQKISP